MRQRQAHPEAPPLLPLPNPKHARPPHPACRSRLCPLPLPLVSHGCSSQYEVYDNLDHIILTVALVKPRPGDFVDRTHWFTSHL